MSAPTNFQVTGCNSFWKIHCFHFFLQKSLCYRIWPCRKMGKGQPRVIIWWAGVPHATYQVYRKSVCRFWRRRFLKGIYHIWAWRPSWSCDPDAANKISFPLPKEDPPKIWLWSALGFLRIRCLSIVDGRTNTDGPWVYYKLTYEPSAQVSYKYHIFSASVGLVMTKSVLRHRSACLI